MYLLDQGMPNFFLFGVKRLIKGGRVKSGFFVLAIARLGVGLITIGGVRILRWGWAAGRLLRGWWAGWRVYVYIYKGGGQCGKQAPEAPRRRPAAAYPPASTAALIRGR